MNICQNCKHEFENQSGPIQVCPNCGEQIDLELTLRDDQDFDTSSVDDEIEPGEDVESELEQTFVSTHELDDHPDDLVLPKIPVDPRNSTEPIDSAAFAQTEKGTLDGEDDDDDDFELADEDRTEVATEFYDPDEKQPTIELAKEAVTASSLDYAEREIVGLGADNSSSDDADYVISINDEGSQLGSGASGVVYKAIQKSLDRTVAIKLLKKQVQAGTQSQSRRTTPKQKDIEKFLYESQITAGLDHPNVITVHDLGVTSNNTLFYSMKLFEGGKDWSKDFDKNSLEENLDIFNDVCDAMRRAHRDRIVHRDLKPQNVLVGDFGEVQVTDWGLAIDLKSEQSKEFSGGGTPCYMAPEMSKHYLAQQSLRSFGSKLEWTLENAPNNDREIEALQERISENESIEQLYRAQIDELSDVYVLGAILFQIASGYPPHLFQIGDAHRKQWGSETGKNKVRRELEMSADGTVASYLVKNLPNPEAREALRDIALKSMAERKDTRFSNVADLQREVRDFRDFMRCIEDTQRGNREVEDSEADPKSYVNLNNALYAFEGALENYPDYEPANQGLAKARFLFAERALNNQDFELGLSTMTDDAIDHQPDRQLAGRLRDELVKQRNRRDRRKKLLFFATMASLVAIAAGVIFGLIAIYAAIEAGKQTRIANLMQVKQLAANENLLDRLTSLKTVKNDTVDLEVKVQAGELELAAIQQQILVATTKGEISDLDAKLQRKRSAEETKAARLDVELAGVDIQIAKIDKIKAQISSEQIKEETQFDQYINRLKKIESDIDEELAKSQMQKLFLSDDISMTVKNAWELHHLYKRANPATAPIENNLPGQIKLLDASRDGSSIVAITSQNRVYRFSAAEAQFSEIDLKPWKDARILSMDVSDDGHWLVIATSPIGDEPAATEASLPFVFDLQKNQLVALDESITEKLRFRSLHPDSEGGICKEKYFCRVQHVEILSSVGQQLRVFMVDQRVQLGLNQLRCSVMDLELDGAVLNGNIQKAKIPGQLFLKDPGLLSGAGCLADAFETSDGSVIVAVANSNPKYGLVVFSLDAATKLQDSKSGATSPSEEKRYFATMNDNREFLGSLSADFAPTAMELVQLDAENYELLVGNGKGEVANFTFSTEASNSFMLTAMRKRLLHSRQTEGFNPDSKFVSNQKTWLNVVRNKTNVFSSTHPPARVSAQFDKNSNYPAHKSAVREIRRIDNRIYTISETEIVIWVREKDDLVAQKILFGQSGKIAALGICEVNDQAQLYTVSNLANNTTELRRWNPGSTVHDATIQLDKFRNKQKTNKRIVAGAADNNPGSQAIALAFDDGTLEYFSPGVGRIEIPRPTDANLDDRLNLMSRDDIRNGKFGFFEDRQQLALYSNSIGLLVWNLNDIDQTDPIRSSQAEGLYRGRSSNSSVFFSSDSKGHNIVTSHPKHRDRFVLWQLREDQKFVATEIGPFEKQGGQNFGQINTVVQPVISPDGKTIACVLRLRNAYQIQLIQTSPTRNPQKIAVFNSDVRTNFRSVNFLSNQQIVISEDRVRNGVDRKTSIVNLIESDGQWIDQIEKLPAAIRENFSQISIADVSQINGKTTFAGFGIYKSNEKPNNLDILECEDSTSNRELIAWDSTGLIHRRNIPFSRRIAPRINDGKLAFFVAGTRSQPGKLEYVDLRESIDKNLKPITSIVLETAKSSSPTRRWQHLGDNRVVIAGDDWLHLATNVNTHIASKFEYSLANPARRVELAGDELLVHHQNGSVSHVNLKARKETPGQFVTKRMRGFHKYIALSPDGNHVGFVQESDGTIGITTVGNLADDDLEKNSIHIAEQAVGLTWIRKPTLESLGAKVNDEVTHVLASVTLEDHDLAIKFWTTSGEQIHVPAILQTLPLKNQREGKIESFDFSNATGKLVAIVWETDSTDTADIWKFAMNRKPGENENPEDIPQQWFLVDDTQVGKIESVHFSETLNPKNRSIEAASRIVISSNNHGSKSIRLYAIELGIDFQTKPLLDLFVTDKLQKVDKIVGARFTGDGKTLLTMTSLQAKIRLSDGWEQEKQDVDFADKIRQFQVRYQSEDPAGLSHQKDMLLAQQKNTVLDPEIGKIERDKITRNTKLKTEMAELKRRNDLFDDETLRLRSELEANIRDEIKQLSSDITNVQNEISDLKNEMGQRN